MKILEEGSLHVHPWKDLIMFLLSKMRNSLILNLDYFSDLNWRKYSTTNIARKRILKNNRVLERTKSKNFRKNQFLKIAADKLTDQYDL